MRKLIITLFISLPLLALAKNPKANLGMPPSVSAESAKSVAFQQSITATGSLSAMQGIMVKPEITGIVSKIYFKSGQDVQKGTPLVALNQDILDAQLKLNQSNLELRQQQFKRAQKLYKKSAMSKADYDSAFANLGAAEAQVAQAQAELQQSVLTAPFSGRLGLRQVSLGDYVQAGQSIVNLQSLDPIVVNFSVSEIYLNQLAPNDQVIITSDSFPNQKFMGNVYAYDAVVDPNTRTLALRAKISNPNKKLLPGMFVNVTLLVGSKQTLVSVPQTALVAALDGTYVYKIINGKALKTKIELAKLGDQLAYIKSGIKPGDMIITAGQVKITADNQAVTVIAPNQKI